MADDTSPAGTRRQLLRAGGSLAAATALGGCVLSTEPYTETADASFDPGDADSLAVAGRDGDVTLSPGDGEAVTGTIRKESRSGEDALDEVTVESSVTDGTLTVAVTAADDLNVSVHLDLSVPGDLAVERATTRNGDVAVTDVTGDATCESENGDVTADGVDGSVSAASTNGDVTVTGGSGVADARTTNGDVDVDVSGMRDDVACESTNGDVTAAVPDGLGASVELRTVNGDASVESVDLETQVESDTRIEGQLSGEEGTEHALTLRTTNGDATLQSL